MYVKTSGQFAKQMEVKLTYFHERMEVNLRRRAGGMEDISRLRPGR
jgi:hypothetical protein